LRFQKVRQTLSTYSVHVPNVYPPNRLFRNFGRPYSCPSGCYALKFLHVIENGQVLPSCQRTLHREQGSLNIFFKEQGSKIGLKCSVCVPYNFGAKRSSLTKLPLDVALDLYRGDNAGTTFAAKSKIH